MSYDLSFDRKTAILLAACTAATVLLLVTAGFLLGTQYRHANHASSAVPAKVPPAPILPKAPKATAAAAPVVPLPAPSAAKPDSVPAQANAPAAPLADAKSVTAKAPVMGGYSLQFGAFSEEANADAMVKQLKEKKVEAAIVPREDLAGATWYTVRSGDYSTLAAASAAAAPLRVSTQQSVFVRPANRP